MTLQQRKKQIEKLRAKLLTLEQIGEKFGISAERVRQILTYTVEYCERHKRKYIGECSYCKTDDEYVSKVKNIMQTNLVEEISRLSEKSRKGEIVMQRVALIKTLKDHYNFSFSQIAKLLNRDFTTIKHLYKK